MTLNSRILSLLNIEIPIIVAPMYMVSNEAMIVEACLSGATGAIPAMNWPTPELMRKGIQNIKKQTDSPFGINIISHASNPKLKEQLDVCIEEKVAFIITSLGNPEMVINHCKPHGIKVFCDVVDTRFAQRLEKAGADAIIAVSKFAGGHAGNLTHEELIPALKKLVTIPIIAAGNITNPQAIEKLFALGAEGASVGTIFIATNESPVSEQYKQALVDYTSSDIVMTDKLSGTPCAVINTPYVQKIGTQQNWLERWLNKHKPLKRMLKQYAYKRGMRLLKRAAFSATYETVWCAGHSIDAIHEIIPVKQRITMLVGELKFNRL